MLEELAARFPERRNWTPADMEGGAGGGACGGAGSALDDMQDRIQAGAFLESARRPDTVRRLLEMIGYKPLLHAGEDVSSAEDLERLWRYYPHLMEEAKRKAPNRSTGSTAWSPSRTTATS